MTRKSLDKKSVEKLGLDFLNDFKGKDTFQWDSNSSNEEPVFNTKSEILWSREKNDVSRNDFFQSLQGGFSDLTEGSTSSCSWHNDEFDMNSSNKVKASLEAIEDALYEQKQSSLINDTVFKECCDWSNKFPYFRLKGKPLPTHDDSSLYLSSQHNLKDVSGTSSFSLQVEGKKMAIHVPLKKTVFEKTTNDVSELENFLDEVLVDDGEYEEDCSLDTRRDTCNKTYHSQFLLDEESPNIASTKVIEDKVIEKVAFEIWPKVLEILQKLDDTNIHSTNEDFQLPPIVSFVGQRQIPRRPRTEGTDEYTPDFPRLNSLLSISPKVLQNKPEYGSWRSTQRSRPNSEIQLHSRNNSVPILKGKPTRASSFISQHANVKQTQFSSSKLTQDKDAENISVFLPAVNEDVVEHTDILKDFYVSPELKEVTADLHDKSPKKSECFLPPIGRKNHMPSNSKLTKNLFTFFGPQLKSEVHNGERPATRPNTSASRKALKYSGNLKHKLTNEHSSLSHTNQTEAKKLGEVNSEKPVTLFPIVTSLLPHKERNSSSGKKGFLTTFGGGKKR